MADKDEIHDASKIASSNAKHINIRMQQGEHTGQPIYSNFTSVHGGEGVIIVDFGFLDPQTVNALNRLAKSGEKMPDAIGARMSCRMAISIDAANNLARQLNNLLHGKPNQPRQTEPEKKSDNGETKLEENPSDEKNTVAESPRGFRLPWSTKVQ